MAEGIKTGRTSWRGLRIFDHLFEGRRLRIFIVPTWFCVVFNLVLLGTMGFGVSSHNLFFLACGLVVLFVELLSMIEAHVNLRDLTLLDVQVNPVEEFGDATVNASIGSKSQSFGIRLYLVEDAPVKRTSRFSLLPKGVGHYAKREVMEAFFGFIWSATEKGVGDFTFTDIPRSVAVDFKAKRRGSHVLPKLVAVSMFPFGMFRVWREITCPQEYVAFPSPKGESFRVLGSGNHKDFGTKLDSSRSVMKVEDDYSHHSEYQAGDSLRRIDWRASSRKRSKIVKVFGSVATKEDNIFRWGDTNGVDGEKRLSQLSLWIHEATSKRLSFKLELPGVRTNFGSGVHHFNSCVSILACYDLNEMKPGGRS
jgi:hypothetical protein